MSRIKSVMKMMMMMILLQSALADPSLKCHHDFFNTFTCVWNISKLQIQLPITAETNCSLHVTVIKANNFRVTMAQLMSAESSDVLTASVEFQNQRGIIIPSCRILQQVICENYENPVVQIEEHKAREGVVKVRPPAEVNVHGLNVSWSSGSPKSKWFSDHEFELQYKSAEQDWTEVKSYEITEPCVELLEDSLILHERHVLRVRDKLSGLAKSMWSEWTQYQWTSEVGKPRPTPGPEFLGLDWSPLLICISLIGIILILIIFFKCNTVKWMQKIQSSYIPDPAKYFSDLNTNHQGNFSSWLGSAFALESFNCEFVSPVELVKLQNACDSHRPYRHSRAQRDGWENFSNSTYFLSQGSSGPHNTLEPCSANGSYGPAGAESSPEMVADVTHVGEEKDETFELESSLKTLEKLRQDTQSPDSGFAAGAEDSMEKSDLSSPLGLNLLPQSPLGLPAPHPNRHLLLGWEQMPLVLGLNRLMPNMDFDLNLLSSCGMIEPSSGDYMPVKNVQN